MISSSVATNQQVYTYKLLGSSTHLNSSLVLSRHGFKPERRKQDYSGWEQYGVRAGCMTKSTRNSRWMLPRSCKRSNVFHKFAFHAVQGWRWFHSTREGSFSQCSSLFDRVTFRLCIQNFPTKTNVFLVVRPSKLTHRKWSQRRAGKQVSSWQAA